MADAIEQPTTMARAISAFQLHKSLGLTVLALTFVRLGWRIGHSPPPLPAHMPRWEKIASKAAHWGFYALLIALPLAASEGGSLPLQLFDSFYRSGSLVFGGGHVVLPLLREATVTPGWVTDDAFLAGYGAAQAVPGPLFTFSAYLGAVQSGMVLFATFIGGASYFFGPILGAILVTYLQLGLTSVTSVWQLYFGIIFIGIVMFAPGGIAGLLMMHRPLIRARTLGMVIPSYLVAALPTLALACGVILSIETVARYSTSGGEGGHHNRR